MGTTVAAIIVAAGRGRRMGADKALLDLGGRTAVERVAAACREGGADPVVVVRAVGAAALPATVRDRHPVVEVPAGGEMIDSIRAGSAAVPADAALLVFPVDYAMVAATTVRAVVAELAAGAAVVLPLWDGRPGHPVGLADAVRPEIGAAVGSLRDVVVADPARVRAVAVEDRWVRRDLDTPEDLAAARAAL